MRSPALVRGTAGADPGRGHRSGDTGTGAGDKNAGRGRQNARPGIRPGVQRVGRGQRVTQVRFVIEDQCTV